MLLVCRRSTLAQCWTTLIRCAPISWLSHPFHLPVSPFLVRNLLLPPICCLNLFFYFASFGLSAWLCLSPLCSWLKGSARDLTQAASSKKNTSLQLLLWFQFAMFLAYIYSVGNFFFLHRRIAHDSCGQVPARLVKKKSTSAHIENNQSKTTAQKPKKQHRNQQLSWSDRRDAFWWNEAAKPEILILLDSQLLQKIPQNNHTANSANSRNCYHNYRQKNSKSCYPRLSSNASTSTVAK